jgi:hypothetical protein
VTKRNENRDQEIWASYELISEDLLGQFTSEQIFSYLAKQYFGKEDPESALSKVKKIIEVMRKSGRKYYPSINQPMTKKQAATYLNVSVSTIDRLRATGALKSQSSRNTLNFGSNKGSQVFFRKEWLDAYLINKD